MKSMSDAINNSRKIVIKIGSNVLSDDSGTVNREILHNIAEQVVRLMEMGKQVVIVSSGAGICGVGAINKWSRRGDVNYKQALCAIGQVELMMAYKEYFGDYDIHVGQILLTAEDFSDASRTLYIRNALFTLVDEGVVPIINEHDSVSIDTDGKSSFGTGGVVCKIEAARTVNNYGIPMLLLNGKKKNIIIDALAGNGAGTLFTK